MKLYDITSLLYSRIEKKRMINNNTIVINLVMNYSICELNSQMSLNFFHFPKYENGINAQLSFNDTKFYTIFS